MTPTANYRPDVHGLVEASYRTKPPAAEVVAIALALECPDCNVNVFLEESAENDGIFHTTIAHDATCPWLAAQESPS